MNIILFSPREIAAPLSLEDDRARHLCTMLHAAPGAQYRAGIVDGVRGHITIERITTTDIHFHFHATSDDPLPLLPIRMLIGHPRPLVAKRLIPDLIALGVEEINFFIGENSEKSYLHSNIWRAETLLRMRMAGAEQAGSTRMAAVNKESNLHAALCRINQENVPFQCYYLDSLPAHSLDTPSNLPLSVADAPRFTFNTEQQESHARMIIAVGSERGWSSKERALLERGGYRRWTLGPRILRTATAAISAAAIAAQCYWNATPNIQQDLRECIKRK